MPRPRPLGAAYQVAVPLDSGVVLARRPALFSLLGPGEEAIHLDLEGRLHRAWLGGMSYERGLDGRLRVVRIARQAGRRDLAIRRLDPDAAGPILDRVIAVVR